MADKLVTFKASLDAQQFNQEISRIEKKLQGAGKDRGIAEGLAKMQPQLRSLGINIDKSTSSLFGDKAKKGMKDYDNHIKKQLKDLGILQRVETQRTTKIKDFQNQLKGINAQSKDFKNIQKTIVDLQEKQNKNLITQQAKLGSVVKASGQLKSIQESMQKGGPGGSGGGRNYGGLGRSISTPFLGAMSAVGAGVGFISKTQTEMFVRNVLKAEQGEDIIRQTIQQPAAQVLAGKGGRELMTRRLGTVKRASDLAKRVGENREQAAELRGAGGATIAGIGMTVAGLMALTAMTLGTGGLGLPLAIGLGSAAVGYGTAGEEGRMSVFQPEKFAKTMGGRRSADFQQQKQREMRKHFREYQTFDYLERTQQSHRKTQQMLALNDAQLFGTKDTSGFYTKEFTEARFNAMSGQIAPMAGISAGRKLTRTALFAEQNLRLGNAGQILGKIAGGAQNPAQAKQEFIAMLKEGTRLGFNDSTTARLQEKFFGQVSATAFQIGGEAGGIAAGRAGFFNRGQVPTMRELQGIQSATNVINRETTGRAGGLRQSLGMAELFKKTGGDIDMGLAVAFENLTMDEIAGNTRLSKHVLGRLSKYGIDRSEALKIKAKGSAPSEGARKALEKVVKAQKNLASAPPEMKEKFQKDLEYAQNEAVVAGQLISVGTRNLLAPDRFLKINKEASALGGGISKPAPKEEPPFLGTLRQDLSFLQEGAVAGAEGAQRKGVKMFGKEMAQDLRDVAANAEEFVKQTVKANTETEALSGNIENTWKGFEKLNTTLEKLNTTLSGDEGKSTMTSPKKQRGTF